MTQPSRSRADAQPKFKLNHKSGGGPHHPQLRLVNEQSEAEVQLRVQTLLPWRSPIPSWVGGASKMS